MVLKILVPFNFSEPSVKVLKHTVRLSGLLSEENEPILLHVIEEISTRMALEEAFGSGRRFPGPWQRGSHRSVQDVEHGKRLEVSS